MHRLIGSLVGGALAVACGGGSSASGMFADGGGVDASLANGDGGGKVGDASVADAGPPKDGPGGGDAGGFDGPTADATSPTDDGAPETGAPDGHASESSTVDAHDAPDAPDASDAAAEDATGDAHLHDASTPESGTKDATGNDATGGVVTCGGVICYAGQSCVGGLCETTDCVGFNVPGDYPTVQAAANAVRMLPAGGTICLAAQTFSEFVEGGSTGGLVTIQGMGPRATTVQYFTSGAGSWALQGLTLETVSVGPSNLTMTNDGIAPLPGDDYAMLLTASASGTVSLQGVAILGNGVDEAIAFSTGTSARLTVESSYISSTGSGIALLASGNVSTINVVNSTFASNGSGLDFATTQGPGSSPVAAVYNSLFLDNGAGVDTSNAGPTSHNAFYGNLENYTGMAVGNASDSTANPLVDNATPPGLLVGSPCRSTGDPAHAAALDFYGRPRGATPDIGAVQSSP